MPTWLSLTLLSHGCSSWTVLSVGSPEPCFVVCYSAPQFVLFESLLDYSKSKCDPADTWRTTNPGTQQLTLEWRRVEISIMAFGSWDTTLGKEWGIEFYLSIAVSPALPEQSDTARLTLVWRTWLIFLQPSPYCFTRLLGEVLLWCSRLFFL